MLIDSLLQSVQTSVNSATQEYREQYFQKRLEHNKLFHSLLESLQTNVFPTFNVISQTLQREALSQTEKLLLIESAVNEHLTERANLEQQVDSLAADTSGEQTEAEFYEILQRKSLALQRRASDIVRFLKTVIPGWSRLYVIFKTKTGRLKTMRRRIFSPIRRKHGLMGKVFRFRFIRLCFFRKSAAALNPGCSILQIPTNIVLWKII